MAIGDFLAYIHSEFLIVVSSLLSKFQTIDPEFLLHFFYLILNKFFAMRVSFFDLVEQFLKFELKTLVDDVVVAFLSNFDSKQTFLVVYSGTVGKLFVFRQNIEPLVSHTITYNSLNAFIPYSILLPCR